MNSPILRKSRKKHFASFKKIDFNLILPNKCVKKATEPMQERSTELMDVQKVREAVGGDLEESDFFAVVKDSNVNNSSHKLKSMVLLQLEVIKEQADQLLKKDKQIAALKAENEELRQKLEQATTRTTTPPRKSSDKKRQTPAKRKTVVVAEESPVKPKQVRCEEETPPAPPPKPLEFLTAEKPYLTCEWKLSQAERDVAREPAIRACLEIPSWKECDLDRSCYSMEGTEDLSDEVFAGRHKKFETIEKRRKRWDVQRLREVRTVEKLRLRYMKEELQEEKAVIKATKPAFISFYPAAEQLSFIQIVEHLPVLAFGEPIPKLTPQDYQLPWRHSEHQEEMSPSTSFTKTRFFSSKTKK